MLFGNVAMPGVAFECTSPPCSWPWASSWAPAPWPYGSPGRSSRNFGIVVGGTAAGLWDVAAAQGIVSSLGMGVMMGCGVGVIAKNILSKAVSLVRDTRGSVVGPR